MEDRSYDIRVRIEKLASDLTDLGWSADEVEEFFEQVIENLRAEEEEDDDEATV